jgi:hypothetical protein
MKWITAFSLTFFLVVLAAWGQAPGSTPPQKKPVSPFAEYAGEWTSTLDGQAWLRLRLELVGDQLNGELVHARKIELKDDGEVKSVSEQQSTETITEAVLNPDGLALSTKDLDTQETNRYLMRLVLPAKDAAEVKTIGKSMPPGMPKPKPWRLVKSAVAKPPENQTSPPLAEYAGDWISTFDGKVWLLVELSLQGEQLTGWFTHSHDLELNDEGGLKSVSDDKVREKIADATPNPDGLLLTVKNRDSEEPDHYLMQMAEPAKAAVLTLLSPDMPANMPKPKPWVLLKFEAAPPSKESTPH